MPLDAHGQPTTKVCDCGRELGRTARRCTCGHEFHPQHSVESLPPTDLTDHELLLAKLRAIGLPEIMKWEALARRYAVAHYRQDHAG